MPPSFRLGKPRAHTFCRRQGGLRVMHLALLMPGPMGTLLILFIALVVVGKNLPTAMRSLGSSVNEFKKGLNDASDPQVAPVQAAAPLPAPAPSAPVAATKQLP